MINFSFIVLFHNNSSTDCVIDSIIEQSIPGDEIIIVDDHSTSENLHMFDRFKDIIKLVHSDYQGNRGYNRNFGASYATKDYLLFVDGDIVFLPNAIMAMRVSMEKGNIGAVGNVICSSNTLPQMNILTGKDYLNLIRTELSIESIIKLNLFSDQRQHYIYDKIALNSIWEYFYTAYCAVKTSIFNEVGGFETNFVGWGVEDDELGYRLHFQGPLEYNLSAYAVHVPHMRNLYECLVSNRINLYRFLAKFPSNELEIHMTFGNTVRIHLAIDYIKTSIFTAKTYVYDFLKAPNCIYINELTNEYPNGYVCVCDKNVNSHILELFGIALPFKNKNFDVAFCTENLFIYPEAFFAAILNEMLRIAREIHIIKVKNPLRLSWDAQQISALTYTSTSGRIVYSPNRICDFDIIDCGDYYQIKDGISAKMNENFMVNENFYHPEWFENQKEHYILMNLTNSKLSFAECNALINNYNIIIDSCYDINIELPSKNIRLTQVLYGDLYRIHTHMIYLIPNGYEIIKDDRWWDYPCRQNDIIIKKYN